MEDAIRCYRQATIATPDDPYGHVNLGYALIEHDQFQDAVATLRTAVALDPSVFDAHYLLGQALASLDSFGEASESFQKAVDLHPSFEIGFRDLGRALANTGNTERALAAYRQSILLKPDFSDAILLLGTLLIQAEQYGEALIWIDRLLSLSADDPDVLVLKAQALHGLKRLPEALEIAELAASKAPDNPKALHGRANVLFAMDKYHPAVEDYDRAIALHPEFVEAISNCASALQKMGQGQRAIGLLERALSISPKYLHALYSLSFILMANGRSQESLDMTTHALALYPEDPNLHWNKAIVHLLLGQFRLGWAEYEWRWQATMGGSPLVKPNLVQPQWTGQDLTGKAIVLVHEQGLGDSIQFLRYAPLLKDLGASKVFLKVPKALYPLLTDVGDDCTVLPDTHAAVAFDFYCSMLSLPMAFATELATIPAKVPYIHSDSDFRLNWSARLGAKSKIRVGLVWSGNANHQNDYNRSIPLEKILKALPPTCEYFSLQKEVREADQQTLEQHPEVRHFGEDLVTFGDTAALLDCVDLVISVDTSVAHLAGALGRPLWLLLPKHPDWRWMLEREDSPWYPTARLFRQKNYGDWHEVLNRVAIELDKLQFTPP